MPLKIEDLVVGTGAEAVKGKQVTVHYTGWLTDGKKFDSSKDHGSPFQFALGRVQVIDGWDQGVAGPARAASFPRTRPWCSRWSCSACGRSGLA